VKQDRIEKKLLQEKQKVKILEKMIEDQTRVLFQSEEKLKFAESDRQRAKELENAQIASLNIMKDLDRQRKELWDKTTRLERFQKVTVGVASNMVKLKEEVNELLVKMGQLKKYKAPDKIKERRAEMEKKI